MQYIDLICNLCMLYLGRQFFDIISKMFISFQIYLYMFFCYFFYVDGSAFIKNPRSIRVNCNRAVYCNFQN